MKHSKANSTEVAAKNLIGYEVQENCQLNSHNFEAGEKIIIEDHCEDSDWPGINWYDNYPQIFEPIYERHQSLTDRLLDNPMQEEEDFKDLIDAAYPSKEQSHQSVGHTPGEWKYYYPSVNALNESANYFSICLKNDPFVIAKIPINDKLFEAEANASLIAAAPDLLEALKMYKDYLDSIEFHGLWPVFLRPVTTKIQEAINKATKQ